MAEDKNSARNKVRNNCKLELKERKTVENLDNQRNGRQNFQTATAIDC